MKFNKSLLAAASLTALTMVSAGCSQDTAQKPPKPTDKHCNNWEWDNSLGVWKCSDTSSTNHGSYFYNGHYFATSGSLKSDSDYDSYSKSSSFAGESESASSGHEGGFGGGEGGGGE